MPTIQRNDLYDAIYTVASEKFAIADNLEPYLISRQAGTPLYRYVSYRSSMPQGEAGARTVWSTLANDTGNRWTGQGTVEGQGSQGLYLSGEYLDVATPFPELDHYLDRNADPNALVNYFRYEPGVEPQLTTARAGELRSMFLFSLEAQVDGINLSLNGEGEHPLLEEILEEARQRFPEAFAEADTLETLYYHGDDASFCRAIGNAVLENTDLSFFQTTSVRDQVSTNVIMRPDAVSQGSSPKPISTVLRSEGRSTFFLRPATPDAPAQAEGVFTIADLLYNTQFEPPDVEVVGLPSKAELNLKLTQISTQIVDNLVQTYTESLSLSPATPAMENVGARIASVQEHFEANRIGDALTKITEIKQQMTQQLTQNRANLQAHELRAFEVVESVMESLSSITTVIDQTNRELENPEIEPLDGEVIDIEDPPIEDVDPVIESPDPVPDPFAPD